ncbi:MAG TPA: UbiA-like protein EboC [Ohtaekwangia sp.]
MDKINGFLRLMRPANLVTAVADILAGIAIAGVIPHPDLDNTPVILLIISTIGLYGGGVVFNDVFDAELDKTERPERPIPSGVISKTEASLLGSALLVIGIVAAIKIVFNPTGIIAIAIAAAALIYDRWGKHQSILGPINMGLCRGLNLLLGISVVPAALSSVYFLAFIPVLYIAAITMISRGEVHGGNKRVLIAGGILYSIVIMSILIVAIRMNEVMMATLFLVGFSAMIFPPLINAIKQPSGKAIGKAVKAGVIALIIMNAAWAAAAGTLLLALIIIALLPLSLLLGKLFAVT